MSDAGALVGQNAFVIAAYALTVLLIGAYAASIVMRKRSIERQFSAWTASDAEHEAAGKGAAEEDRP